MKKYKILWNRNDYGNIIIEANSKEEAIEMFDIGDYNDQDLNIKDGGMEFAGIEVI